MGNTPRNAALTIGKTSVFVNRQSLLTLPLYKNRLIMQKVSWFPSVRESSLRTPPCLQDHS